MAKKKKKKGKVVKDSRGDNRNYREEYDKYQASDQAKADRAARNKARRQAIREGKVKKGDGKEIDHKTPLDKGGSKAKGNTRVVAASKNRGWRKDHPEMYGGKKKA